MYVGIENVCHAVYDGPRQKYDWRHGRGGRKWQRWWRRWRAGVMSHRRAREMFRKLHRSGYDGTHWGWWHYDDPEVRHHCFTVRMGGEGRFGPATKAHGYWTPYGYHQEPWRETGPWFHVIAIGQYRKHGLTRGRIKTWSDHERQRQYEDAHYRWNQSQLKELHHERTDDMD